jgi:hypothetical protein
MRLGRASRAHADGNRGHPVGDPYEKANIALPKFNLIASDFSHREIRVENGICDAVYVFSAELRECNISL